MTILGVTITTWRWGVELRRHQPERIPGHELAVVVTRHAVERAQERFNPAFTAANVCSDIAKAVAAGRVDEDLPWARWNGRRGASCCWTANRDRAYAILRRGHRIVVLTALPTDSLEPRRTTLAQAFRQALEGSG